MSSIQIFGLSPKRSRPLLSGLCCIAAVFAAPVVRAADLDRPHLARVSAYADLADLALAAPVVIAAKVHAVVRVGRKSAPDLAVGVRRYLVRADVISAILAPGAVPSRIEYLWDVANPNRPDIDDARVLVFLQPVANQPDRFRLVSARAQIVADPSIEARVRGILLQARDPVLAGGRVIGVTRAFTVPGALPGDAETQIFLRTAGSKPASLVVTSHQGEPKRYAAAFGDAIDAGASPVKQGTLAWYDLACGLPPQLPAEATVELDAVQRAAVVADYAFVLGALGPCGRTSADDNSTPTEAQSG